MSRETSIAGRLRLAVTGGIVGLAVVGVPAFAQSGSQSDIVQQGERVEVTGSSIKRIGAETALPVITLTTDDIKKSGFLTVTDLIQNLPSMQGFTQASQSVNGGGGGATTASLHSIGSQYTLVLLNGRRIAPYTTGTDVNLSTIPLGSIERVEILLDGASALYGADAIAGVVNFITKKNSTDGEISVSGNLPQHEGGKSGLVSFYKGYGDIDRDRFNIFASITAQKQDELKASQREFSKTGIFPFTDNGRSLTAFNTSGNTIPGSVTLNDSTGTGAGSKTFSPNLLQNGTCPTLTFARNGVCRFDLANVVDTVPESEQISFFGSGRFKVAEALTVFSEVTLSSFKNKPVYAPPAQPGIVVTPALYNKYVAPYLAQLGVAPGSFYPVGDPSGLGPSINLRLFDAGGRQDEYKTNTANLVFGAEGTIGNVDYSGYFTHSENKFTDKFLSGYTSANALTALVASGAFDPLGAGIGQSTAVLAPAVLHQVFDQSKSTIDVLHGQVTVPVYQLPAGDIQVALGAEGLKQKFRDDPSAIAQGTNALQPNYTDTPIGGSSGLLPFNSYRYQEGAFVEAVIPVLKGLEVTGSTRHDHYSRVTNDEGFDALGNPVGSSAEGKSAAGTTYKLGIRYIPAPELLFRGSIGTGFKAPTLADITNPAAAFGNTGFHSCPPGLPAALAARCQPVAFEYNLIRAGNPFSDSSGLDPEKSKQFTLGFRIEPSQAFSLGLDFWSVKLKQRIDFTPEDVAFGDGATYANFFSVRPDPVTGIPTLTLTQAPQNQGKARYKGLDFDAVSRVGTGIGTLTTKGNFTYMLQSDYQIAGLDGYQSSLGRVGPDTQVTFRWILNLSTSLETGPFVNTLAVRVKPTYHDDVSADDGSSATTVRVLNANGTVGALAAVKRDVASYTVFDFQSKYTLNKSLNFTFGVRNLFNRAPPLSILDEAGTGNAQGFDGRYTDPIGRSFFLGAAAKF